MKQLSSVMKRTACALALLGIWGAQVAHAQNASPRSRLYGVAAAGEEADPFSSGVAAAVGAIGGSGAGNATDANVNGNPNVIRSREPAPPTAASGVKSAPQALRIEPPKPNAFQNYVLETTGYRLPLFGQSFFENTQFTQRTLGQAGTMQAVDANGGMQAGAQPGGAEMGGAGFAPVDSSPVSAEYLLGPGDQVLVRAWGSLDMDARGYIDRNGALTLPRIGSIQLGGVKAAQADGVIRSAIGKYFKDFEVSVTLASLRPITVYVVGQARRPGSYTISGASTLSSGLFATGGPSPNGSVRHVQLKRAGQLVREFDLYSFLAHGDSGGDVKLADGDVIVIPPAVGYVAMVGTVNNPAVYEIAREGETLDDLLKVSGGLPVTANQQRVTLERLNPGQAQPRSVESFSLADKAKAIVLKSGDVLTVQAILPELANAVTLRGHVSQPTRLPWHDGMRVRDLIPNKESLINRESVRMQNETLFDKYQRERSHLERDRVPSDLAFIHQQGESNLYGGQSQYGGQNVAPLSERNQSPLSESYTDVRSKITPESVGRLFDEINWDYAVIERINRNELNVSLIPFNLAHILANDKDPDNKLLQPGDIVTVFSAEDMRVPIAKRRLMVRIEGEVNSPGYYQLKAGDNLLTLLQRAGGLTSDAYLFGSGLYREEVRKTQTDNLDKLIRRLDAEGNARLLTMSQSTGASSDALMTQNRLAAAQQVQRQTLERLKTVKPEGRIALNLTPDVNNYIDQLPELRLQNGDRLVVPTRPDFVYVFGSVNTESALMFKSGKTVDDYLMQSGLGTGADRDAVIVVRADGSAVSSNNSGWFTSSVGKLRLMPGDSIVVPDKVDMESTWSSTIRNTKDITQIIYQLGIGAAAFKALGY